ncbi:unnamed protein product [Bursaphelenchus okinawaensis]|uniref:Uncharacterized protein n=1 Tax=Bursaphelenchus okinawaensis TaxID=465554 RepID=A0A811KM07_9BILA|nr:unnamed protein product [Bursaphelenchus okinawaensis]CAG9105818.1 unnamed protein product [Bursaphelenchus okinawaensis]
MSLLMEKKPPEQTVSTDDIDCTSDECKTCRRMMNQRLQAVGFFADFYGAEGYQNFIEPVQSTEPTDVDVCTKYRFARNNSDTVDYQRTHKHKIKRQVVDLINSTMIGTRYNLSCTTKGSTPDGNADTELLSLCAKCWAWRQLPSNYFPQFINELVCHDGDTGCLSGYGSCGNGERTVEVLRNDTYKLTMVTLSAASFCECQVRVGSAIQDLVTGNSTSD